MLSHEWELPRRHSQDGGAVLHISRCPEWAGLPQGSHTALVPNGPQRRKPSDMSYSERTIGAKSNSPLFTDIQTHTHNTFMRTTHRYAPVHIPYTCVHHTHMYIHLHKLLKHMDTYVHMQVHTHIYYIEVHIHTHTHHTRPHAP